MADDTEVLERPLGEVLSDRYLSYALSTIMARSLPDVRDGLKPVHRRLLYGMRQLQLNPTATPKKSARVVGDVMGQYHPHGDAAIYDAMVRLAQDFALRYPLVDGHGNFGNIDGDNPAAMRYTEARLTAVAEALLAGIDEDAVDFQATYDGGGAEPVVLPARFPNLLANGASGIAVGMATEIPPHNVGELCAALRLLVRRPDAGLDDILKLVPGPDFPTGGLMVEPAAAVREAYATGRGSFRLRARWVKEERHQGTWQIVVTQIPYRVAKSALVERIAELLQARKLPLLDDVRDESAEDVRLVLVPKSRNVDPVVLMESLFRATDLERRVPLNMNVLDGGRVPRVMALPEVLRAFLAHRMEVLERRTRHRLERIAHRLEVLGGLLIAFLNLDEVIRIIREADEPKPALIERFTLTEVQAEAILNMRLRSLRRLEEMEIRREHDGLVAEQTDLRVLLADEGLRWKRIDEEIQDIDRRFGRKAPGGARRTDLAEAPQVEEVPPEALVEREPVTVLLSRMGWIRTLRGHAIDPDEQRWKDGDGGRFAVRCETTDRLLLFTSDGRVYTLGVDRLPRGRGFGEPLRLMIDLADGVDAVALLRLDPQGQLLVAASDGRGFRVQVAEVAAQTRAGRQVLNLAEGALARFCLPVAGDHVAALGDNRKLLVFPLAEVPEMARGRGVILQRHTEGSLADLITFRLADGLSWPQGERRRVETDLAPWLGSRGQAGRLPPHGFPRSNRFA